MTDGANASVSVNKRLTRLSPCLLKGTSRDPLFEGGSMLPPSSAYEARKTNPRENRFGPLAMLGDKETWSEYRDSAPTSPPRSSKARGRRKHRSRPRPVRNDNDNAWGNIVPGFPSAEKLRSGFGKPFSFDLPPSGTGCGQAQSGPPLPNGNSLALQPAQKPFPFWHFLKPDAPASFHPTIELPTPRPSPLPGLSAFPQRSPFSSGRPSGAAQRQSYDPSRQLSASPEAAQDTRLSLYCRQKSASVTEELRSSVLPINPAMQEPKVAPVAPQISTASILGGTTFWDNTVARPANIVTPWRQQVLPTAQTSRASQTDKPATIGPIIAEDSRAPAQNSTPPVDKGKPSSLPVQPATPISSSSPPSRDLKRPRRAQEEDPNSPTLYPHSSHSSSTFSLDTPSASACRRGRRRCSSPPQPQQQHQPRTWALTPVSRSPLRDTPTAMSPPPQPPRPVTAIGTSTPASSDDDDDWDWDAHFPPLGPSSSLSPFVRAGLTRSRDCWCVGGGSCAGDERDPELDPDPSPFEHVKTEVDVEDGWTVVMA